MSLLRKLGLYLAAGVVLMGVVLPATVHAQDAPGRPPLSLMTSPLPLNVVTKPGQQVTADLRVRNNGTQAEQLKVELLKFGASGDTGRPQLQEKEATDVYFDWVTFSETNFTAEPNVWKTVKMTVKPPKEAAFGYYFAVLFTRANPDRPTGGNSAVEGGVASLVLLNVDAPGARREAKVAEVTASQKVYEFLPAKLKIKLRNSGNVHVSPVGSVFIKQGSKQVASLNFNVERGNILPNSDRTFEVNWNDGFPVFEEKTEGGKTLKSLKWDFGQLQNLRFGKYTATLVAVYDDGQRDVPVEAVVSFWVIPWRILGILLLIILLIVFGIWAFLRFIWKSIRRQAATDVTPNASSLAAAPKRREKEAKQAANDEGAEGVEETTVAPPPKKSKPVKKAKKNKPAPTQLAPFTTESTAPTAVKEIEKADKKPAAKQEAKNEPPAKTVAAPIKDDAADKQAAAERERTAKRRNRRNRSRNKNRNE